MTDETIRINVTGETAITGVKPWHQMKNTGATRITFEYAGGRFIIEPGETVTVTKDVDLVRRGPDEPTL